MTARHLFADSSTAAAAPSRKLLSEPDRTRRNLVAAFLLFLAVASWLTWRADPSLGFGPDQVSYNLAAKDIRHAWDHDLPLTNEFGSWYRQSFAALQALGSALLGSPELSYKAILFGSALAYLLAMYLLLAGVVETTGFAALVAILSVVQRYALGTSFWGMGEFQSILPRIMVLAIFPLAWLIFERGLRSGREIEAFLPLAVAFAIHLSAVYFYLILLLAYGLLIVVRRTWSQLTDLVMAALFFLLMLRAVPSSLWSRVAESNVGLTIGAIILAMTGLVLFTRTRRPLVAIAVIVFMALVVGWLTGGSSGSATLGIAAQERLQDADQLAAANSAIYARFGWSLFPVSLATLGFVALNCLPLAVLALIEYARRWKKGPTQRELLAAAYVTAVVAISLGATAALQLFSRLTGRPDAVLELFRAFKFIYLPLYIYLALLLERWWRTGIPKSRGLRRLGFAVAIALLLIPPRTALAGLPDGLKLQVRAAVEQSGALNHNDHSQRTYLQTLLATSAELERKRSRRVDLLELCAWVKNHTPDSAMFMTTLYDFVDCADREIMISYQQGAGSARSMANKHGHVAWHEAYLDVSGALTSGSPERVEAVAHRYDTEYVLTTSERSLNVPLVYRNDSYKLYRLFTKRTHRE